MSHPVDLRGVLPSGHSSPRRSSTFAPRSAATCSMMVLSAAWRAGSLRASASPERVHWLLHAGHVHQCDDLTGGDRSHGLSIPWRTAASHSGVPNRTERPSTCVVHDLPGAHHDDGEVGRGLIHRVPPVRLPGQAVIGRPGGPLAVQRHSGGDPAPQSGEAVRFDGVRHLLRREVHRQDDCGRVTDEQQARPRRRGGRVPPSSTGRSRRCRHREAPPRPPRMPG